MSLKIKQNNKKKNCQVFAKVATKVTKNFFHLQLKNNSAFEIYFQSVLN